jgi:pimeloyl-ACP methyl ester carboxylesterase
MRLAILFFVTLATAHQTPLLNKTPLPPKSNAHNLTISAPLFAELEELARIVDITYCVGVLGAGIQQPFDCLSRCKDFESFELVTSWNTGPLLSDSCGYIALSHEPAQKRIVVAFRGTYSISSTIADLSTWPQEYVPYPGDPGDGDVSRCDDCSVHMGFYKSWENTRDVISLDIKVLVEDHPDYQLVLVGHSLGGAVAAFAGLEYQALGYKPIITTVGEPRLGNQAFADYVDRRFKVPLRNSSMPFEPATLRRITHMNDPVPLLPLEEWGYRPHGGEIYISKSDLAPEQSDVRHCLGDQDPGCSIGEAAPILSSHWAFPTRFKMWQILFAHRDYFHRLGICVPDLGWWWPKEPGHG